jgi:hypothetical protein
MSCASGALIRKCQKSLRVPEIPKGSRGPAFELQERSGEVLVLGGVRSLGLANLREWETGLSISYCFISRRKWRWDLYRYQRRGSWLCGESWETHAVRN